MVQLTDDATAKVTAEGLLGSKFIALEQGGSETLLADGGVISNTQGAVDIWSLISQAMFDKGNARRRAAGADQGAAPGPNRRPRDGRGPARPAPQQWSAGSYDTHARFVSDLASGVVDWLAPQPGERILDVGCGDGVLTADCRAMGADVVGVDFSEDFVAAAAPRGLDARLMDGEALTLRARIRRGVLQCRPALDAERPMPWWPACPRAEARRPLRRRVRRPRQRRGHRHRHAGHRHAARRRSRRSPVRGSSRRPQVYQPLLEAPWLHGAAHRPDPAPGGAEDRHRRLADAVPQAVLRAVRQRGGSTPSPRPSTCCVRRSAMPTATGRPTTCACASRR